MADVKTIKIDDVEYVRKDSLTAVLDNDENYVIVRSQNSGVHAGYVASQDLPNGIVNLKNSRRIWYWDGAASLSQLALEGVNKPQNCKFSVVVPEITILQVIEIIPCTIAAIKNISQVKVWKS